MQKKTLIGIIIIIVVAAIICGGVFAYQYFTKSQTPITKSQINPNGQNANTQITNSENVNGIENKNLSEEDVKKLVLNSNIAKCAGIYSVRVDSGVESGSLQKFNEPVWTAITDSQIEDITFIIGKNSGKILYTNRQVFNNQCLLSPIESQKMAFCCGCINKNPLCVSKVDVVLSGNNLLAQVKQTLGGELVNIPIPGDCKKVSDDIFRNTCYNNQALSNKNYKICDSILDAGYKDGCYMRVASEIGDKTICDKIQTSSIRDFCYKNIK